MSCIRFNTPAQLAQLDRLKKDKKLSSKAIAQFLSPEITESKILRIRELAKDKNPKIRESVALGCHTPEDVMWDLAKDKDEGVRVCVARNETTPCDILRYLSKDKSETVRSWVAVNFFVPDDVMVLLADDKSKPVRKLVGWKLSLVETP